MTASWNRRLWVYKKNLPELPHRWLSVSFLYVLYYNESTKSTAKKAEIVLRGRISNT